MKNSKTLRIDQQQRSRNNPPVLPYRALHRLPFREKRLRRAGSTNNDHKSRIRGDISRPLYIQQYPKRASPGAHSRHIKTRTSRADQSRSHRDRTRNEFQRDFLPVSRGEQSANQSGCVRQPGVHVSRRATTVKYRSLARRSQKHRDTHFSVIFQNIHHPPHLHYPLRKKIYPI